MSEEKEIISARIFFTVAGIPGFLLLFRQPLYFFTSRTRDLSAYNVIDISAVIQIIFLFICFIFSLSIVFLSKKNHPNLLFRSPQVYLLLYTFICFLSMLWSPDIMMTGYRAFEVLTYLMLISLVVSRLIEHLSYQNMIEWAILWISWDLSWSIVSSIKWEGFSYLYWPFSAARLAVPMFFFFALLLTKRNSLKFLIIIFTILSVSNKIYFGIAFGLLGFYYGNIKNKGWLLILGLATAVSFSLWGDEILQNTLFYGREGVGMEYTSGRDKIWEVSWEAIIQKPFLGHGFVTGETNIIYNSFKGAISTHNFILSGLIGTGIIGTIPLILYFISAFGTATSKVFENNNWKAAFVSTIIMATIISLTAPGVGGRVYGSWIPVVLVFTIISGIKYKADKEITEFELKHKMT